MITKFTILGERCSGTNLLENAILKNFVLNKSIISNKLDFTIEK
jgi:hypothetical protein